MKKNVLIIIVIQFFTLSALACLPKAYDLKMPKDSSFKDFPMRITFGNNGIEIHNDEDKFYFSHTKQSWCVKSKGEDENCRFSGKDINAYLKATDDKPVGQFRASNSKQKFTLGEVDDDGKKKFFGRNVTFEFTQTRLSRGKYGAEMLVTYRGDDGKIVSQRKFLGNGKLGDDGQIYGESRSIGATKRALEDAVLAQQGEDKSLTCAGGGAIEQKSKGSSSSASDG